MIFAVEGAWAWRYLGAIACVAIALVTRVLLVAPLGASDRFEPFYTAVLLAALLGRGPGILASVLSLTSAWFFFTPPVWSYALPDASHLASLSAFAITAALSIFITDGYRREREGHVREFELFKTVQDISLEGLVVYRAVRDSAGAVVDFEYRYANPVALAVVRKAHLSELKGDRLLVRIPFAREHPALFPRYLKVLATGVASEVEYELGGQWYYSAAAKLDDGLVVTVQNISARKRAEGTQKLLLEELNHRVKNLLSSVIAMATMAGRSAATPEAYREELLARLHALSRAHGLLSASAWSDADVAGVVKSTLAPYLSGERNRFEISGPVVRVGPDTALALHMAMHELATNAIKYGALSADNGRVAIRWDPQGDSFARLLWSEKDGPAVLPPSSRGFGSRLFESAFAAEGGLARLVYDPAGVFCELRFRCEPCDATGSGAA